MNALSATINAALEQWQQFAATGNKDILTSAFL
jgi:hypothetical protein